MSNTADEPLKKVTINLYAKDVAALQERYVTGYQEIIRKMVRKHIRATTLAEEE